MQIGTKKAWLNLAVFLLILSVLVAFASSEVDNLIALAWVGVLFLGSGILLWRRWRARSDPELSKALRDARWGSIVPPKLFRWMIGEDEDSKKRKN